MSRRSLVRACCGILLLLPFLFAAPAPAGAAALPPAVEQNLGELLQLSMRRNAAVRPECCTALLEYVYHAAGSGRDLVPQRRCDGNGSVLRLSVHSSLPRLMEYCYNPAVPNYLFFPSVLRLSGWEQGSDILRRPHPWTLFKKNGLTALWGTEHEVNAPDGSGGAYYRYGLHRLLILTKIDGRDALISVSKQIRRSGVGRKAAILDDPDWIYFYSGIKGLNKGFIGWADTYMYDSASVQVYIEGRPHVTTVMLFKWLRAGWAGLNVVRKTHIDAGMLRYAKAFKAVMNSRRLPSPEDLAKHVRVLSRLPEAELQRKIGLYSVAVERIALRSPAMRKSEFQRVVAGGSYFRTMNREERLAALILEYFKGRLGRRSLVDFSDIPGLRS